MIVPSNVYVLYDVKMSIKFMPLILNDAYAQHGVLSYLIHKTSVHNMPFCITMAKLFIIFF